MANSCRLKLLWFDEKSLPICLSMAGWFFLITISGCAPSAQHRIMSTNYFKKKVYWQFQTTYIFSYGQYCHQTFFLMHRYLNIWWLLLIIIGEVKRRPLLASECESLPGMYIPFHFMIVSHLHFIPTSLCIMEF